MLEHFNIGLSILLLVNNMTLLLLKSLLLLLLMLHVGNVECICRSYFNQLSVINLKTRSEWGIGCKYGGRSLHLWLNAKLLLLMAHILLML